MDLLESVSKKFIENYSKGLSELNKNVYSAAKLDNGKYEAPVITVSAGGGTVLSGLDAINLASPAEVKVELLEVDPLEIIYRLGIPRSELEIADKNPAYFKYLFDKILEKGLANYRATVGGPEKLRFGSHYVKASLLNYNDGADFIELRLSGSWAKEA